MSGVCLRHINNNFAYAPVLLVGPPTASSFDGGAGNSSAEGACSVFMIVKILCRNCGMLIHIGSSLEDLYKFEYCLRCRRLLSGRSAESELEKSELRALT